MSKLKKRLLIALTLFCSFFALTACSETKIADKPENSAVYTSGLRKPGVSTPG